MTTTYTLHKIENAGEFGFSPDDYSRFKFGSDAVAQKFGEALAEGFIQNHLIPNRPSGQFVVLSSPYSFIPTATFALKNYFVYSLNAWLAAHDLPVVQEAKVHRTITYKEDYGELDAAQRMQLIGNDTFHIDRIFVEGKILLFLDDIRITGSHERMILKMVAEYGLANEIHLLYFAELTNKNIHPNIENFLNYYSVKDVWDLEPIINSGRFALNTRVVKYLLNADLNNFASFIPLQCAAFIHQLYNMALGNGYHTIEAYQRNLHYLSRQLPDIKPLKTTIEHGH